MVFFRIENYPSLKNIGFTIPLQNYFLIYKLYLIMKKFYFEGFKITFFFKNNFMRFTILLLVVIFNSLFTKAQIKWVNAGAATAWYTATNWLPGTPSFAWLPTSIAQFDNTGTATTAGINMGVRSLSIGAIVVSNLRARNLTIGNSSLIPGVLQLNGATVDGTANVILRRGPNGPPASYSFTLQDNQTGTGKIMDIALGNVVDNVVYLSGDGGFIDIRSRIVGTGKKLTLKGGGGSGAAFRLYGANTYTGLTTVNKRMGIIELNRLGGGTLPSTNSVDILDGKLVVNTNQTLKKVTLKQIGSMVIADGASLTITDTFFYNGGGISLGITGTGKIVYAPGATLVYQSSGLTTSAKEFPALGGPTNVVIRPSSLIYLHDYRTISGLLKIENAVFILNEKDFTASSVSAIGAFGAVNSHVVTNGTGKLIINNIGSTPVTFPIGATFNSYNPLVFSNGQGINYGARVETGINPAIANPDIAVNRTWYVIPALQPVAPVQISFNYSFGEGNAGFNYASPVELGQYNTSWNVVQTGLSQVPQPVATTISTLIASTNTPFVIGNSGAIAPVALLKTDTLITQKTNNKLNNKIGFDIQSLVPTFINSTAVLSVTTQKSTRMNVVITDFAGRQLQQNSYSIITGNNKIEINFSNLIAGIYHLVGYTAEGKSKPISFIKQ
jgi:hypothetical protein